MGIVETLLETARADTKVLMENDRHGDILSRPRLVTFLLLAKEKEKADLVASFIYDNRYGATRVESTETRHAIFVDVLMPIEQNILCGVSGLMACVATIFEVEYDGWSSAIQRA